MQIADFAERICSYCLATGGSITSWWRSVQRNAMVGGKPRSLHLRGLAVDVVYDSTLSITGRDEIAARYGLMIVHEGDHDHVQPQKDRV